MIFLLQLFTSLFVSAFSRTPSYVCPGVELTPGSGVVCCDTLEGKSCEETKTSLLTSKQILRLDEISAVILATPIDKMIVQNCFRTALDMVEVIPATTTPSLTPDPFFQALAVSGYEELPDGQTVANLKPLDVITYDEKGQYKGWEENEGTSGKHPFWFDDQSTNHALIYLGQGLVVQKENTFTAVSSISTLERSFDIYEQGALTSINKALYTEKKITFYMRVFRKKAAN